MRIIYIMEALKEAYQMKDTADKQQLNLTVNSDVVKRARDLKINISEITEKVLRAFTTSSKTGDKEKLYQMYQELFNLMLPLLKKFQVKTPVAREAVYEPDEDLEPEGLDPYGDPIFPAPEVIDVFTTYLGYDRRLVHDGFGEVKIKTINIQDFLRPQDIIDELLVSIQEGVDYRKEQFKEIEMAKTIIDAITKGVIPKSKDKGKKK